MIPKCLVILVPGAGLEPARTLPGPRDFKSANYYPYQQPTCRKVLYQWGFPTGAVPFCSFQYSSLVTAIVTVKHGPGRARVIRPAFCGPETVAMV
jgi:hypothetical protein